MDFGQLSVTGVSPVAVRSGTDALTAVDAVDGEDVILIKLAGLRSREDSVTSIAQPTPAALRRLHGTVSSLSGAPVAHAAVRVLNEEDDSVLRTSSDEIGRYSIDAVPAGTHHILVTARHSEPEIVSVSLRGDSDRAHDFALQQWGDPEGNLVAESVGEREQHNRTPYA
ncbi:carboxypeptidase-like regulatory domain-containing protein [Nonomuraea polychroma]|uniref:carboxypeptidase-like regulatory domain-containing protein n=1 Tax=Nonomuraea polychroma TaxID=46176 RepID=UPI003D8D0965